MSAEIAMALEMHYPVHSPQGKKRRTTCSSRQSDSSHIVNTLTLVRKPEAITLFV